MDKKREIVFVLVCFLLFLIAHSVLNVYVAKRHTGFFLAEDGPEYFSPVESFVRSGRFMTGEERYYEAPRTRDIPEAYRPPLMAFLTALLSFVLHDTLLAGTLFLALAASFLALAAYATGKRLGGPLAGAIAAVLVSVHPLLLSFSLRYSSDSFFTLFLLVYIFLWLMPEKDPSGAGETGKPDSGLWVKYFAMGGIAGLACGVRPTALLLLPAYGIYLLVRLLAKKLFPDSIPPSGRRALLQYGIYAAAFLIAVSPLCIRNRINYGTWSPSGCLGGFNLFVGNNLDNAAAYCTPENGELFLSNQNRGWERAIAFAKAMPEDLSPVEQDKLFREAAWEEIRQMGWGGWCLLSLAKAWHFIRPWPLHGAHPPVFFWGVCCFELLLFLFGFAGVFLLRGRRSFLLLLLMIFCVGWSAHSVVHLHMRHRVPFLDLPLILLASVSLGQFVRWAVSRFFPAKKAGPGSGAPSRTDGIASERQPDSK